MKINKEKSKILIMDNNMQYTEWEKSIKKKIAGYEIALKYKSLGVII